MSFVVFQGATCGRRDGLAEMLRGSVLWGSAQTTCNRPFERKRYFGDTWRKAKEVDPTKGQGEWG